MTREEIEHKYPSWMTEGVIFYNDVLFEGLGTANVNANPKSPWINVKDKLPYQDNTTSERTGMTSFVSVIINSGEIFIAQMIRKNSKWYWINDNLRQIEDIVYWMHIPNPQNNIEK